MQNMQFNTQVIVPSLWICYLQALLHAGFVSMDADGNVTLSRIVLKHLYEMHQDLAGGDGVVQKQLDEALDQAIGGGIAITSI